MIDTLTVGGGPFDTDATRNMREAFDRTCETVRQFGLTTDVTTAMREVIASAIVKAARSGVRDPAQLHEDALKRLGVEVSRRKAA